MINQAYLERWTELAKKAQEPLQAMTQLHVKTLQNFNYLKPEELAEIKKPEEFFEKHIQVAVKNSHQVLDYMQKSFEIFEKAMLCAVEETKKADSKKK